MTQLVFVFFCFTSLERNYRLTKLFDHMNSTTFDAHNFICHMDRWTPQHQIRTKIQVKICVKKTKRKVFLKKRRGNFLSIRIFHVKIQFETWECGMLPLHRMCARYRTTIYLFRNRHYVWSLHLSSSFSLGFSLVSWICPMLEWVRPEPKDSVPAMYVLGGRCPTTLYRSIE